MDQNPPASILICGAGPTGLVLALWLAKRKLPFRIIDKAPHPGAASRALVVQARTLEFYRQLGIEKHIPAAQRKMIQLHFWVPSSSSSRRTSMKPCSKKNCSNSVSISIAIQNSPPSKKRRTASAPI